MDDRTKEYFRALREAQGARVKAVNAREDICTCQHCIEARARRQISPCQMQDIQNKVIDYMVGGSSRSNFFPELSPNYFDNKSRVMSRRAF